MKDLFYKELTNFGLSEKESKIYITLLELEVATVYEVAKHAGVNRSSAYVVLEGLKKKGLVGISDDKKVRHYVASSPEVLLHTARQAAQKTEDIRLGIEQIVPELKALHKDTKRKPIVKVLEGKNGLISAFEETLNVKEKKMRVVSSIEKIVNLIPEYFSNYVSRRIKKGVVMYGIHPANKTVLHFQKMGKNFNFDKTIVIPEVKYTAPADLAIFDNKIGYMSAESGGYAIMIESREMAEVMKNVFDMAYEEAKRLSIESH